MATDRDDNGKCYILYISCTVTFAARVLLEFLLLDYTYVVRFLDFSRWLDNSAVMSGSERSSSD